MDIYDGIELLLSQLNYTKNDLLNDDEKVIEVAEHVSRITGIVLPSAIAEVRGYLSGAKELIYNDSNQIDQSSTNPICVICGSPIYGVSKKCFMCGSSMHPNCGFYMNKKSYCQDCLTNLE